jgi:uncharacterized membrane protein YGL010W
MALFSARTWDEWIAEYAESHRHPVNRVCHTVGIPMIVLSAILFVIGFAVDGLWAVAAIAFVVGWVFQLVGHAYERKPPEFFKDWRFLFVGLRWWWAKLRGRA